MQSQRADGQVPESTHRARGVDMVAGVGTHRLSVYSSGAMMTIGGLFAIAGSRYTLSNRSSDVIMAIGVMALLYGVVILIRRDRVSETTLKVGLGFGSVMVVAIVASTDNLAAVGAGSGFVVWVALYAACFMSIRLAIAYVGASLLMLGTAIAVYHPQQMFVAFGSAAVNTVIVLACTGWMASQLRALAVTDGLTGLVNAAAFHNTLRVEVERARRSGEPLAVIFIDVDGLKVVNDRDGHRAGDELIVGVADTIRAVIRSTDTAARVGGDEFAIALPATTVKEADMVVGRMRPRDGIRFSVGTAAFLDGDTPGHLLTRADEAMYRQKEQRKAASASDPGGSQRMHSGQGPLSGEGPLSGQGPSIGEGPRSEGRPTDGGRSPDQASASEPLPGVPDGRASIDATSSSTSH